MKTVAVSGGFDPVHIGHIKLFANAKALGDKLVVILNNDIWLKDKKGYVFMNEEERKEILLSLSVVDEVIITAHEIGDVDTSVCSELGALKPDIFANGGDRKDNNTPEVWTCRSLGIEMAWNVGGEKTNSSSELVANAEKAKNGN